MSAVRLLAVCLASLLASPAAAAAQDLTLAPFGGRSFENPYYVDSPPGDPNRVMVVEGAGTIWLVKDGVTSATPFLDLSQEVLALNEEGCGECGLFSIAFAPDYAESGRLYASFAGDLPPADGSFRLRVDEFRRSAADPDLADPASRRMVLDLPPGTGHYGGQLEFGPDGFLYLSFGDAHTPATAQDLAGVRGKILRIDPRGAAPGDYSAAPGNPFADGAGPNADEVYSYGLRNPYRFSFDRSTGDLAIADVGQHDWEEVDFAEEGRGIGLNHGWPCFEGSGPYPLAPPSCTPAPAQTPPAFEYAHPPVGSSGIIGGYVVRDPSLPSLLGRYVYADSGDNLAGAIRSVRLLPGGSTGDAPTGLAIPAQPSFGEDACGHIYVTSFIDEVFRIEPAAGALSCKLAPRLWVGDGAVRPRGIAMRASCDEDCDLSASGFVRVRRGRGGKPFSIAARPATLRMQLAQTAELTLGLRKGGARRLRAALRAGRRVVARYRVSATGGGGGTDVVSGAAKRRG